jgi:hypothetical protein
MDAKSAWMFAVTALLIYAGGTGRALCDLCPAPFMNGTMALPGGLPLHLKASTRDGVATLTGPNGTVSGQSNVICQSGQFNAMFYSMSDGSLYRCHGSIDEQSFTGQCRNGAVTGEISGKFERP